LCEPLKSSQLFIPHLLFSFGNDDCLSPLPGGFGDKLEKGLKVLAAERRPSGEPVHMNPCCESLKCSLLFVPRVIQSVRWPRCS